MSFESTIAKFILFENSMKIERQSGEQLDFVVVPNAAGASCLAVNSMAASGDQKRMVVGTPNGTVHSWRMEKTRWQHDKEMSFHKTAVNDVDVHASGRMAFSVAR